MRDDIRIMRLLFAMCQLESMSILLFKIPPTLIRHPVYMNVKRYPLFFLAIEIDEGDKK